MGHYEFIAFLGVIPEQVLAAAHMAEEEQDVALADGPEIGTRAVVADEREGVVFDKGMQVGPVFEVLRLEEEVGAHGFSGRAFGFGPGRERVVPAVLLPDARVENPIRKGRTVGVLQRDDGFVRHLLPV